MPGDRRVFDKEFKLMSVELGGRRPATPAPTLVPKQKNWITRLQCYSGGVKSFPHNRLVVSLAVER